MAVVELSGSTASRIMVCVIVLSPSEGLAAATTATAQPTTAAVMMSGRRQSRTRILPGAARRRVSFAASMGEELARAESVVASDARSRDEPARRAAIGLWCRGYFRLGSARV